MGRMKLRGERKEKKKKTEFILKDYSKFQNLDSVVNNDSISRIEAKLQQRYH